MGDATQAERIRTGTAPPGFFGLIIIVFVEGVPLPSFELVCCDNHLLAATQELIVHSRNVLLRVSPRVVEVGRSSVGVLLAGVHALIVRT